MDRSTFSIAQVKKLDICRTIFASMLLYVILAFFNIPTALGGTCHSFYGERVSKIVNGIVVYKLPKLSQSTVDMILAASTESGRARIKLDDLKVAQNKYWDTIKNMEAEEILNQMRQLPNRGAYSFDDVFTHLYAFLSKWSAVYLNRSIESAVVRINEPVSFIERNVHPDFFRGFSGNPRDFFFLNLSGPGTLMGNKKFVVPKEEALRKSIPFLSLAVGREAPAEFKKVIESNVYPINKLYELQPGEGFLEKSFGANDIEQLRDLTQLPPGMHAGPDYDGPNESQPDSMRRVFVRIVLNPK